MQKKKIKKIISLYCNVVLRPITYLLSNKKNKDIFTEQLLIGACKSIESDSTMYVSSMFRKKIPHQQTIVDHKTKDKIAVVLQGPLDLVDNFTLNTVRYYLNELKIDFVIVSTWIDENKEELRKMEDLGAIVIRSKYPQCPGIGHSNYQIASFQAGLKAALDSGANYICKTRTDQRLYNEFSFEFMQNLLVQFPVNSACNLKKRIIALGDHSGSMFFPYYISDFLYFGTREDMRYFLDIPLDTRTERESFTSYRERCSNLTNAEIYIMKNFILESGGKIYTDTIYSYWKFIKESLILLDKGILGLYWHKYDDRYTEHRRNSTLFVNDNKDGSNVFNFTSWMSLYNEQLNYKPSFEEIVDRKR